MQKKSQQNAEADHNSGRKRNLEISVPGSLMVLTFNLVSNQKAVILQLI